MEHTHSGARRRVLLYELNEVPWEVVDRYTVDRPRSHVANLLANSLQRATVDDDPVELMPWRTWPTLHYSRYTEDHGSFDQAQDPSTFRGTAVWDAADAGGCRVGVFGALQSWPPHSFRNGGFFVPDSFASGHETIPMSLEWFQRFNINMTDENNFAPDAALSPRRLASVGARLLATGLTARSAGWILDQLRLERRDERYRSRRPIVQVLVAFDLFWRLHRRHDPHLSLFFTNHVASMMHRFWGDWMPGYAETEPYQVDAVHKTFVPTALDRFDHQLGRIVRWVDDTPGAVLLVASSMGQGPIPYEGDAAATYVLVEPMRLASALDLRPQRKGVAMYPRTTFELAGTAEARDAAEALETVVVPSRQRKLFHDLRVVGRTVSAMIDYSESLAALPRDVAWRRRGAATLTAGDIADLGIAIRRRPGGSNTAQHTRDGIVIAYGAGIDTDTSRSEVDILDVAPSILELLDVQPPAEMHGKPSLFLERR